MSGGSIKKQISDRASKSKTDRENLDFMLQKFLQESDFLESKQKIVNSELAEIWKKVNLKSVYKKIIDNNN